MKIILNGSTHEIGINGNDDGANISLASFSLEGMKYAKHRNDVRISVKLLNKGSKKGEGLKGTLSAFRKSSVVSVAETVFSPADVNETVKSKSDFVFHTVTDTTVIERFKLTITDASNNSWTEFFEVPVYRNDLPEIKDFQIADGRKVIVTGRGTGADTIHLGTGNGNGVANPGETIIILIKDGNLLRRSEILVSDELLNTRGENKKMSDYWGTYDHVGGSAKYSAAVVSSLIMGEKTLSTLVEYWMPDAPDHIIKQGIVNIKVTGIDKTPPSVDWVKVTVDNTIMLKLTDGSEIKQVTAKLSLKSDPEVNFTAVLNNDGLNGDGVKGDCIFSYRMPIKGFGFYTMDIAATDSFANRIDVKAPGIFVLH
ncbi:MAG: hypothetical protein IPN68_06210 [Bacteroidetes bacterium]|nr:hypothetical protein [Bacteroidota bacterium]